MAKTGVVLSELAASTLTDVVREFKTRRSPVGPNARLPAPQLWLEIYDFDTIPGKTNIWKYYVYVYENPLLEDSAEPIDSGIGFALNIREKGNTASSAGGRDLVTEGAVCGDITGIEPLPLGWYPCWGPYLSDEDEMVYILAEKNDWIIEEAA